MNILVVGSLREVTNDAEEFVCRLGEAIVERNHTLLTGCRGSLDKAIAESAKNKLDALQKDCRAQLVSYRLKNAEPVHRLGTIHVSARKDWELTHPELTPPEQIATAHAAIFVAGSEGTFVAANWARIAGIPVLGVAGFGGAGGDLYELEYKRFEKKYAKSITRAAFEVLNQDTLNLESLARDVISLAERIVMPSSVFVITRFAAQYRDVRAAYHDVCRQLGFNDGATVDTETTERIIPRIYEGIERSAFVIAEVSETSPNVFYEIGYAHGLGKQVICTARKGTVLPFDIADANTIFWEDLESLKEQLKRRITAIKAELEGSSAFAAKL